ncbi:MAG: hypothetical protein IIB76_03905 [Proteobacteria bacterium]|nr:hypothetical protein [Pseudomonadota bacterium]
MQTSLRLLDFIAMAIYFAVLIWIGFSIVMGGLGFTLDILGPRYEFMNRSEVP